MNHEKEIRHIVTGLDKNAPIKINLVFTNREIAGSRMVQKWVKAMEAELTKNVTTVFYDWVIKLGESIGMEEEPELEENSEEAKEEK